MRLILAAALMAFATACSPGAPVAPTAEEMQAHGRRFPPNHLHDSWMDYLYWDVELEA